MFRLCFSHKLHISVFLFCFVVFSTGGSVVYGEVNARNGNFMITYTDAHFPGSRHLSIIRTYNSKANEVGIFGTGWGCDYETYLKVYPSGKVVVFENGSGSKTQYLPPKGLSKLRYQKAVRNMMVALQRSNHFHSTKEAKAMEVKLKKDSEYRMSIFNWLVRKGLVAPSEIPLGQKLISHKGNSTLIRVKEGYIRSFTLKTEYFDNQGRFVKEVDNYQNFFRIVYRHDGTIYKVLDKRGIYLVFYFNSKRLVERIVSSDGGVVLYKYKDKNLIYCRKADGVEFRYEYDNRSNMTKITYNEGSTQEMKYTKKNFCSFVKHRDGSTLTYKYGQNPKNPKYDYHTTIVERNPLGNILSNVTERYVHKVNQFGWITMSRRVRTINGNKVDIIYDKKGWPYRFEEKDKSVTVKYNHLRQVIQVNRPRVLEKYSYYPNKNWVAKMTEYSPKEKKVINSLHCKYDGQGTILSIGLSSGKKFRFSYEPSGQLQKITLNNAPYVEFSYSKKGKVREITYHKKNKVSYEYFSNGKLKKKNYIGSKEKVRQIQSEIQNLAKRVWKKFDFYTGRFSPKTKHYCAFCVVRDDHFDLWNDYLQPEEVKPSHYLAKTLKLESSPSQIGIARRSGKMLISIYRRSGVLLSVWDLKKKEEKQRYFAHKDTIFGCTVSPDEKLALTSSRDCTLKIWDIASGKELKTLNGHLGPVFTGAFSPNGEYVLSGGEDKNVILWNVKEGKSLLVIQGHTGGVRSVSFSPDGKKALSGSFDETVRLWDLETGKEERIFIGHKACVLSVQFSSNGKLAYSSGSDNAIRVWEVKTGRLLRTIKGHCAPVYTISLSRDGTKILSTGYDHTVRVWDSKTGKELYRLIGHKQEVFWAAFLDHGRKIVSTGKSATLRFWDLDRKKPAPSKKEKKPVEKGFSQGSFGKSTG